MDPIVAPMTTTARTALTRRARRIHPRRARMHQLPGKKSSNLPEHLEAQEVPAVLAATPNPCAGLLLLLQWRGWPTCFRSPGPLWPPTCHWTRTSPPSGCGRGRADAAESCRSIPSCRTTSAKRSFEVQQAVDSQWLALLTSSSGWSHPTAVTSQLLSGRVWHDVST